MKEKQRHALYPRVFSDDVVREQAPVLVVRVSWSVTFDDQRARERDEVVGLLEPGVGDEAGGHEEPCEHLSGERRGRGKRGGREGERERGRKRERGEGRREGGEREKNAKKKHSADFFGSS